MSHDLIRGQVIFYGLATELLILAETPHGKLWHINSAGKTSSIVQCLYNDS